MATTDETRALKDTGRSLWLRGFRARSEANWSDLDELNTRRMSMLRARENGRNLIVKMWLAAIVSLTVLSGRAGAQGTDGMLPDPITAQDLDAYAARLDLSAQQRGFLQGYHEEYKAKFSALRDGTIDAFLKQNTGMQAMLRLMDRKAAEETLREYEGIVNSIRGLDSALFDQMQGMVSEAQSEKMIRVRQLRERKRYEAGFGRFSRMGTPAARADLSEIAARIELSAEEAAAIDPALAQYESALTSGMRKQYEAGVESVMEMVKAMEAAGITAQSVQGEGRREAFRAMEGNWRAMMMKMNEHSTELAELNTRTMKSVAGLMSAEHGRGFKHRYYEQAYRDIGGTANTERALGAAQELEELSAEQKAAISAMAAEYISKDDSMVDQMVVLTNKAWALSPPGGPRGRDREAGSGNSEAEEARAKIGELKEEREALADRTMDQLRAALGEDGSQRMDELMQRGARVGEERVALTVQGGAETGEIRLSGRLLSTMMEAGEGEEAGSRAMAGPIRRKEIERLCAELGLGADEKVIVLSAHDDYFERFSALREGSMKQHEEAERGKYSLDPDSQQMRGPTVAQIDAAASLRNQVMEEIRALDESLFADVATVSGKDASEPTILHGRMKRQREVYARAARNAGGATGMMGGGPGGRQREGGRGPGRGMMDGGGQDLAEGTIDISRLVEGLASEGQGIEGAMELIAGYDAAATPVLKQVYETRAAQTAAMERAMARAMAEREREGGDGGRGPGGFGAAFRDIEAERTAAREAEKTARLMNREWLVKFEEGLGGEAGAMVRQAYHQRAYPAVFTDERSAEMQVMMAQQLGDLNEEQSRQLGEAALEYRSAYWAMSEKMVKLMQETADNDPMQNRDWGAYQQRQQEVEKLRFERNDLSDSMRSRLKVILTEEQAKRAGL